MKEQLEDILTKYEGERGDLIPLLQEVQTRLGYLPAEAMQEVAKFLRLSESTVYGVCTFYAQFKLTPSGKHIVRVCRGTACHVKGGARMLREVEKYLGINPGETTLDMEYTLETVACIGACAIAPNMVIDNNTYGQLTIKKVAEIFNHKEAEG